MSRNLTQLAEQLREIWKQLGVNQRISVVLATAVVLGGIVGLSIWSSRADYALLYGKLSESECSKILSALDEMKVPYKASGGGSISVPADKVHSVRMKLAGKGIPKGEGVGFEIFDKPNFGISDFVQRANFVRAVQGELARTIAALDEIEEARVALALPESRILIDKDRRATASVMVRVRGNATLSSQAVNAIQLLVANSVEGLKPSAVSVVDSQANKLSENEDETTPSGLTSTQLGARKNTELYLSKKVESMLERVLGPGQAIVRVAAEINYNTISATQETFDPESQVIRTETKNDENVDTSQAGSAEPVGVTVNTGSSSNSVGSAPLSSTRNQKNTARVEYEISKTTSNIFQVAGGLKRISAAVTIAARYEGAGATRKTVNRTPEELEKLRRMVASALGADTQKGDQVTLEELPFNEDFGAEITRQLERDNKWQFWIGLLKSLGYPALAFALLYFLVRQLKRTPIDEIPLGVPLSHMTAGRNGNGNGNGHGVDWRRQGTREVVTVDVLNQLVKEQPGNMTQAIRQWLERGNGAPESPKS